jgi:hypothetical protein
VTEEQAKLKVGDRVVDRETGEKGKVSRMPLPARNCPFSGRHSQDYLGSFAYL